MHLQDAMLLLFNSAVSSRYTPRPWYKPEPTSALGKYWQLILFKLSLLPEMPSQKYFQPFLACYLSAYFIILVRRLKSEGYRIEELVSDVTLFYNTSLNYSCGLYR